MGKSHHGSLLELQEMRTRKYGLGHVIVVDEGVKGPLGMRGGQFRLTSPYFVATIAISTE